MATTVTPPVPAAPAAAAPAAPAPAPAPSPPPAAPPAAAPAAAPPPAPAAAPDAPAAAAQPAAQPAAPAAPAAPAGPPKTSDFHETEEGIEQFIEASEKWRQEHPDQELEQPAQVAPEAGAPAAEEAPKPPEQQPAPQAQPGEAPPLPTPQAFDDLLTAKPDFKALFDRDPEAKTQVMDLARAAEAAKPVLDIVPTVEEARFATGKANEYLNLQHLFAMAAEDPEMGERGWNQFVDLFKIRDDKGAPVLQNGVPQMAESFDFIGRKFLGGALGDRLGREKAALTALQQKLESGVYPSEAAKEADRVNSVDIDYKIKALRSEEHTSELQSLLQIS